MSKYELVERYYASGIWDERKVRDAVSRGWISEEEYEGIVGEKYVVAEGRGK